MDNEGPFYLSEGVNVSDIMGPNGVVYSSISTPEAKSHVKSFNHAWRAAGGPALRQQRDELRALLKELEWSRHVRGIGATCPRCNGVEDDGGHAPDCRLAAAIGGG